MRAELFGERRTGGVVAVSGMRGITHAFIPDPLPPRWEWPQELWPLLLDAHRALSSLDGTGKHLHHPELVLRPLQYREALRSSSLEGTYADPQQQMLFEIDPRVAVSRDDPVNAHREVFNYARALRFRREDGKDLPLSLRLVRQLHAVLMDGVRGSDQNPGQFRRTQNQVGRPARYVPPPTHHMGDALHRFESYLHAEKAYDPLVEAFLVHYQFEAIHPFLDGNGRVGRLLLALTIAEWCDMSGQWLYMSPYFDRNRDRYIDLLFRVSSEGAWPEWVAFCLAGVVEEARETLARCDSLIALNREFHERINDAGGSVRLSAIVDNLFINPVVVAADLGRRLGVTYPTARSDLRKLENLGIVVPIEGTPQIAYFSYPVFEIIYAD